MSFLRRLLFLFIPVFCTFAEGVDPHALVFSWIEESSEFASISVTSIDQDKQGFIWVSTRDGLHRFDGYEFVEYRFEEDDAPSNFVFLVYVDKHGEIWAGTQKGLRRYNARLDRFEKVSDGWVRYIFENEEGDLFTASEFGDVFGFDRKNSNFFRIGHVKGAGSFVITPRKEGGFWGAKETGIFQFDSDLSIVKSIGRPDEETTGVQGAAYSLAEDALGRLWVGTNGVGTWVYDDVVEVYTELEYDVGANGRVGRVCFDDNGNAYVGSSGGLNVYDTELKKIASYIPNDYEVNSIKRGTVYGIDFDRQGNLWVGTSRSGVGRVFSIRNFDNKIHSSLDPKALSKYSVVSVLEDSRNNLWVGYYYGGMDRFDGETGVRTYFPDMKTRDGSAPFGSVLSMVEDKQGRVWFGTDSTGLFVFDYETEIFRQYLPNKETENAIGFDSVSTITLDDEGCLLIGLINRGVDRFDPETETFTHYDMMPLGWVNALYSLKDGDFYVVASNGIQLYEVGSGFTELVRFNDLKIRNTLSAVKDSYLWEKGIWLGMSNGLMLLSLDGDVLEFYGVEDGLPHPEVGSIEADGNGNLWCSTKAGISKFDLRTKEFVNFSRPDGLISNQFHRDSSTVLKSGRMYFGSEGGLSSFDPQDIRSNKEAPAVVFTHFEILNRKVQVSEESDGILNSSISIAKDVTLTPDLNTFTFEFAALNMIATEKNEYKYMLKGFDRDWIYSGSRRSCTYTNLDPGAYTLQVAASNNDGVWNEVGASIEICILPWFWQTTWFKVCIALLVLALIGLVFRMRTRAIRIQNEHLEKTVLKRTEDLEDLLGKLEEQKTEIGYQNDELMSHRENLEELVRNRTEELELAKNKAEVSDRLKLSFLANMSHEIRTPMNAIMGFIDVLGDPDLCQEERDEYNEIVRNSGDSLLVLIDDILDLSRLEAGVVKIEERPLLLNNLMEEIELTFRQESKQMNKEAVIVRWDQDGLIEDLEVLIDEIRLRQILGNLLGNALKFTSEGSVDFGYQLEPQENGLPALRFFVKDTGVGISDNNIDLIFDRFGKVEECSKVLYRGTGLGLSIARKLSILMGGDIRVESKIGEGSTFWVTLPFNRTSTQSRTRKEDHGVNKERYEVLVQRLRTDKALRVLVAEDEDPNYKYIASILKRISADVLSAKNGEEAVSMAMDFDPDIVLMDIKMPVKDGFTAIRELRENGFRAPIVAQTAYTMGDVVTNCKEAGADEYISKPFSALALFESFDRCLGSKEKT